MLKQFDVPESTTHLSQAHTSCAYWSQVHTQCAKHDSNKPSELQLPIASCCAVLPADETELDKIADADTTYIDVQHVLRPAQPKVRQSSAEPSRLQTWLAQSIFVVGFK